MGGAAAAEIAETLATLATPYLARNVAYPLNGRNAEKFLREYEPLFSARFTTPEMYCKHLHNAVPHRFMRVIEEWDEFKDLDWEGVKERMVEEFGEGDDDDSPDRLYEVIDRQLEGRRKIRTRQDLDDYYRRFKRHSEPLVKKEILSWQSESSLFLKGLPRELVKEYESLRKLARSLLPSVEQMARDKEAATGWQVTSAEMVEIRKKHKEDDLKYRRELHIGELYGEMLKLLRGGGRTSRRGRDTRRRDFYDSDSDSEEEAEDRRDRWRNDRSPSPAPRSVRFLGLPLSFIRRQESESTPSTATRSALSSKSRSGAGTEDNGSRSSSLPDDFINDFRRLVVNTTTMSQELAMMKQEFARFQQPGPFYGGNVQGPQQGQFGNQGQAQRGSQGFGYGGLDANMRGGQTRPNGYATGANATPYTPRNSGLDCRGCGLGGHPTRACPKVLERKSKGDVTEGESGRYYFRGRECPLPHRLPEGMPTYEALWDAWEKGLEQRNGANRGGNGSMGQDGQGTGLAMRTNVGFFSSADERDEDEAPFDVYAASRQVRARTPIRGEPRPVSIPPRVLFDPLAKEVGKVKVEASEAPLRDEEMTEASAATNATSTTRRRAAQSMLRTPVSQRFSVPSALEHVLNGTKVELPLGMLLAVSNDLSKGVAQQCQRRRVPIDATTASGYHDEMTEDDYDTHILRTNSGFNDQLSAYYCAPIGCMRVVINGKSVLALVDGGSQVSLIQEATCRELGIACTSTVGHSLRSQNDGVKDLGKVCRNVAVGVGGSEVICKFFVSESSSTQPAILLGSPFMAAARGKQTWHADGTSSLNMEIGGVSMTVDLLSVGSTMTTIREDRVGDGNIWEHDNTRDDSSEN
ncbi:BZ3500_MvSof-1268-A1-R1_Chr12-3g03991 [Microbotryum saponariae]|uniref:BZ3500_MvSof-1268-A1-R1_Chr12-3g03991 protein n=1 Tax=Microbotryum saponariae TaxID=289078 RepID=A0A2X0LF32_9BASI|nr:BZ3500_MvSof-1268-A1-R1_Chr12-3g03991 [Microbotryum saponariae]